IAEKQVNHELPPQPVAGQSPGIQASFDDSGFLPQAQQGDGQQGGGYGGDHQSRPHVGVQGVPPGADGEGVDGAPPLDGVMDQGNVDEGQHTVDGGGPAPDLGVGDGPAEDQVADVHEPGDEGEGEARLPRPPVAPDGLGPDGAADQGGGGEQDTHLGSRRPQPVPAGSPPEQIGQPGEEHHGKAQV